VHHLVIEKTLMVSRCAVCMWKKTGLLFVSFPLEFWKFLVWGSEVPIYENISLIKNFFRLFNESCRLHRYWSASRQETDSSYQRSEEIGNWLTSTRQATVREACCSYSLSQKRHPCMEMSNLKKPFWAVRYFYLILSFLISL
jgi:hypothetical protein